MLDRLPVDLLIMLACMMYEHADRAHLACVCRATAEAARKSDYWEHFAESYGLEDAKRLKLLAQSGRKLPVVQVRLSYRYEEGQDDYMVSDFQMLPFLIGLVDIVHPGVEEFCFAFRSPDTRINLPPPLFNDMFSNLATLELKLNYAEFCCDLSTLRRLRQLHLDSAVVCSTARMPPCLDALDLHDVTISHTMIAEMTQLRRLGLDETQAYRGDIINSPAPLHVPPNVKCLAVGQGVRLSELVDTCPHLAGLTELRAYTRECAGDVLTRLHALRKLVMWASPSRNQGNQGTPRMKIPILGLANLTTLIIRGGVINLHEPLPATLRTLCIHEATVEMHKLPHCVPRECQICLDDSTVKGFSMDCMSAMHVSKCPFDRSDASGCYGCSVIHDTSVLVPLYFAL